MGLRDRLRDQLRRSLGRGRNEGGHDPTRTELGAHRLPDGTVLERCVVRSLDQVRAAAGPGRRDRLVFLYRAADPASAHDLHELRELHLYYSNQLDLVSVAWDLDGGGDLVAAGLAVDAFHRDHGLTWQSLLYDGAAGPLAAGLGLGGGLPRVRLVRPDGTVPFDREGPWTEGDRGTLELLLRG